MTIKTDMIAHYNNLTGKSITAGQWKKSTEALRQAILKLEAEANVPLGERLYPRATDSTGPHPSDVLSEGGGGDPALTAALVDACAKPARKPRAKKEKVVQLHTPGAIRAYCEELLLEVHATDVKTKRPVGLTYPQVLERVKERFPHASTSLGCLRWYATKMNARKGAEAVRLPMREKSARAA